MLCSDCVFKTKPLLTLNICAPRGSREPVKEHKATVFASV